MAGICENGHRSATDDYCDVCGLPVRRLAEAPSSAPVPPKPTSQRCPNCAATNPADALFCEACGYDYTTGTLPRSDAAGMLGLRRPDVSPVGGQAPATTSALDIDTPAAPQVVAPPPVEVEQASPSVSATPSYVPLQPATSEAVPAEEPAPAVDAAAEPVDVPTAPAEESSAPLEATADPVETPSSLEAPADPVQDAAEALTPPEGAAPPEAGPLDTEEPTRGRPAPRRESYVAEVWIDPDWYEVQETDEPMPSVGLPTTVVLGPDNLVGRVSESRNIHPQVDCGVDSGVSRRQSRLSTDGTRWYVEDLGSANGTFVGPASGPLPVTPITGRYELGPDDRVYVGAWTRIVVRKASKEEIDALS